MIEIKDIYPFFYRHKYLIPFLPFLRVAKAIRMKDRAIAEIRTIMKSESDTTKHDLLSTDDA